jgi:hypothetical protein
MAWNFSNKKQQMWVNPSLRGGGGWILSTEIFLWRFQDHLLSELITPKKLLMSKI